MQPQRGRAAQLGRDPLATAQVKLGAEWVLRDGVQLLVERLRHREVRAQAARSASGLRMTR
jgi:hypothetical protein